MENKYPINIFWSEEDDCFVAIIPDFPNLSAFGETHEDAIADAKQVLQMAIDSLERDGISLPQPKCYKTQEYSGQVRLRMPKSLHHELSSIAESEGVSLNTHMVSLLSSNNIAASIRRDIKSQFNKILEHQDQHFAILHRNINQQPGDDADQSRENSWAGSPRKHQKHQIIAH